MLKVRNLAYRLHSINHTNNN